MVVGYFDGKTTVLSKTESDPEMVIAKIFSDYLGREDNAERFNQKEIVFEKDSLVFKESCIKTKIKSDKNPLEFFTKVVAEYGVGIIFDSNEIYAVSEDGKFLCLTENDYKSVTCKICGKKTLVKNTVDGCCTSCFLDTGVQDCFQETMKTITEEYTKYESISKVLDVVESFEVRMTPYTKYPEIQNKVKEVIKNYVEKEHMSTLLGGMLA